MTLNKKDFTDSKTKVPHQSLLGCMLLAETLPLKTEDVVAQRANFYKWVWSSLQINDDLQPLSFSTFKKMHPPVLFLYAEGVSTEQFLFGPRDIFFFISLRM